MAHLFLNNFQPGDVVEDVYVLSNKQISQASNGKHYIKAFISDRSAQVNARMWSVTRELFNELPESGFVFIRGRVENYQNNIQIVIDQISPPVEGSFEISDLLPHTTKPIAAMKMRLVELLESIHNRHLAALVQVYLDDTKLMDDFCRAPAAQSFHHAFVGGLLEHTLNAMEVADAAVKFYPGLNRDLIVAALFLHDIAKTWELKYETSFGYSDGGQLIGHIVKSAMWVEEKTKIAEQVLGEKIPRNLIDVLQHIILSHHEKPEFGAARVPGTPEALFVAMIDNMDAKMQIVLQACRGEQLTGGEGHWTDYIKALGGRLYRPDVAPADAPLGEATDEHAHDPVKPNPQTARPLPPPPVTSAPVSRPVPAVRPDIPVTKPVLNNPLFDTSALKKK